MSVYPDFQEQGYQVIRELGRKREGEGASDIKSLFVEKIYTV
jgi:hypothetical protein